MRRNIDRRLAEIESRGTDWISRLKFIDYGLTDVDYDNGDWSEVFHDDFITVVRHAKTGEVRGYYRDRRSAEEIITQGGNLTYL